MKKTLVKKKWKKLTFLMLLTFCMFVLLPTGALAAKAKAPSKVTIQKISASAAGKVTLRWKKVSGATSYKIYYRKASAKSWNVIADVKSTKTQYTHRSSKKYPLKSGIKYAYRVRAYDSRTKQYGPYSSVKTVRIPKATPAKVNLKKASALSSGSVRLSWAKASNATSYRIYYRKYGTKTWKAIATVSAGRTSYTHRSSTKYPLKANTRYTYAVRGYNKNSGKYGSYSNVRTVRIPKKTTTTKEPVQKARYSYELILMNPYPEVYTDSATSGPILYIKTNNPDYSSIRIHSDPDITTGVVLSEDSFDDVEGTQVGNWLKVDGGYLRQLQPEEAGTYTLEVYELKEEYLENSIYIGNDPAYCYETGASLKIRVKDYIEAEKEWIQGMIRTYTTSDMTPKEKFEAIVNGEFYGNSASSQTKYRYHAVKYDQSAGDYVYASLLSEIGAIWQNHRMDSYTSPRLLCDIGYLVGYDVKMITGNVSDPLHAYVKSSEGNLYTICPMLETGIVENIGKIDFSKY